MSRRRRAAAFLLAAVLAAVAAAAIVESYGGSVSRGYGALRPAVIAVAELPGGEAIAPRALAVRRVPARFVPPGALVDPAQALGLVPAADLPAGAYLLTTQLRPPRDGPRPRRGLGRGRHPVELLVSGAGALSAASPIDGSRVDVIVTAEPTGAGPGRTYVAAAAVPLLGLAPDAGEPGTGGTAAATLALTRSQALRLIAAESFARRLTLLGRG